MRFCSANLTGAECSVDSDWNRPGSLDGRKVDKLGECETTAIGDWP